MRKKLKDTGGLTMVELLCATAILVLLILMMNTGINMAVKSYRDITAESEVELLLSSLTDALTDKLRYCVVNEDETYSVGEVIIDAVGMVTVGGNKLLPDGAYGDGTPTAAGYIGTYTAAQVEESGTKVPIVTYDPDTNRFTVKFTVKSEETGITRTADFTVRCLNPVKKEGTPP